MTDEPWYGARAIFRHDNLKGKHGHVYEERVVLLKADSDDQAVERAQEEAREYAQGLEGCTYLEFVNVYHIYDQSLDDGTEVYSLMRDSKLGKKKYLNHFFDTGKERTR